MKLALLLCISHCAGFACSCAPGPTCWTWNDTGLQFVGRVTQIRAVKTHNVAPSVEVDFTVSHAFGELNAKTITIRTSAQATACGYPLARGIEYLVFANARGSEWWTSSCSGTQPVVTAAAWVRQLRAVRSGSAIAQIFGFIGIEPYPGVSPASRLSAKPLGSITVSAVSKAGRYSTRANPDGSFHFSGLHPSVYRLELELPPGLFIWFGKDVLAREYAPGKTCDADFPLYTKDDLFGALHKQ